MNDINGNPWEEAINEDRNEQMNSVLQQDFDDQRAMLADSENADRADRESSAKQQLFMRNLMGVIVKRSGGGSISPRLANWANGVLRKAGVQDGGIAPGGGFDKSGNFVIPTYAVDANGSQVPGRGVRYDGRSLYAMMNQLRGIFNDNDISRGADFLRKSGVGEKEIASLSYNPFATMLSDKEKQRRAMLNYRTGDPDHISNRLGGGAGGREVGSTGTFKRLVAEKHGIHFFASDGKGGFTRSDWTPEGGEETLDYGTRDPNYQGRWKVRVNGPDGKVYENDKTGEEVTVKPGENLRDVLAKSETTQKDKTGTGVEIAKINAASREKVAGMNNATKIDLAKLTDAQKRDLASAANKLKEYGIDVGLQIAQEGNASKEKIAAQREAGRQARAVMRDDQAWGKLAIEQQKVDNNFAVQMQKADTYGKRVDLIEQKLKNDYDIALKKAKTAEDKQKVDATYKDRMASVAEGNIDLGWFKAETDTTAKEEKSAQGWANLEERRRQFDEREARMLKNGASANQDANKSRIARMARLDKEFETAMKLENEKARESALKQIEAERESLFAESEALETSGDGGTKGKVKYTDLKPGQKFTMTDKDGKKRRCVKTEKGYKYID